MLKLYFTLLFLIPHFFYAQEIIFPEHLKNSYISKLKKSDSIVFYQCHVDTVKQELTTSSGQNITSKNKKITLTEKFVITLIDSVYYCKYYTSSFTDFPNKKFAYLTLKEVKNWNFELNNVKKLTKQELLLIAAFESKTHDIVHYELNVNKSNQNEIIVHYQKEKRQLIVEGNYTISKVLNFQKK